MNRRVMLTAVAGMLAVAMMASPAYAQRGGGWGGGGGRGWGGGGWGGRGWDGGGYYGGYGRGYGFGVGLGGYGWDGFGQGYYGTPDNYAYGTYANYQPYSFSQPYGPNNTGLSNYQLQTNPTGNTYASQSFYSGPSNTGSAQLTVKVPADAQLWLGTMQSGQTGAERHFTFPALGAGDNYFTLRSSWNDNGKIVTRDRQVNMKAGANTTVDLTQATDSNATPSTPRPDDSHPTPLKTDDGKIKTPPIRPNAGLPK